MKRHIYSRLCAVIAVSIAVSVHVPTVFAQKKETVKLAQVGWTSDIASTNVAKAVLQEKLGYNVEVLSLRPNDMWEALANGEVDALLGAWLPTTHGSYFEKVKADVVDLGPNLTGTRTGLVVPSYVTIDSITELNAVADKFYGQIVGIEPTSGAVMTTKKAIAEYELDNFNLFESRTLMMTAILREKIAKKDWVVITGWTPFWIFANWNLKYLDDPKNIYGGEEHISTIVRKGLERDLPEVFKFLDQFVWEPADMQQVQVWNTAKDANPYENAMRWIAEHPDKVDAWLKDVREKKDH